MLSVLEIEEGERRLNKYACHHFCGAENWGAPNHVYKGNDFIVSHRIVPLSYKSHAPPHRLLPHTWKPYIFFIVLPFPKCYIMHYMSIM